MEGMVVFSGLLDRSLIDQSINPSINQSVRRSINPSRSNHNFCILYSGIPIRNNIHCDEVIVREYVVRDSSTSAKSSTCSSEPHKVLTIQC